MGVSSRPSGPHLPVDVAATVGDFGDRYGHDLTFAPILVVIAAFNEDESLGEVLTHIPADVRGLPVDTLVVDDGSTDTTAEVAERYDGVRVARLPRNCGQGAALRVGYRLAAEHGATYVVTLDADMQWDPREMGVLLPPLVDGDVDVVVGSRVLGTAETDDSLRRAGVWFFAALVTLLTGVRVTDTSSCYRAMRTEVTQTVPQTEAQYQSSELLIGAIYAGYRITERPITMHKRFAGESKKGHNLVYGARYARVILRTWRRERSRSRRARPRTA